MKVQIKTQGPNGRPRDVGIGEYNQMSHELTTKVVLDERKSYKLDNTEVSVELLEGTKEHRVYRVIIK